LNLKKEVNLLVENSLKEYKRVLTPILTVYILELRVASEVLKEIANTGLGSE